MEVYCQCGFFAKQGSEAAVKKALASFLLLSFMEF